MWYDVVVLGVLAFFTIRGAMKGVIWQLAGIAGIAVCFLFADGISQTVGPLVAPHVKLQEPLNHWVILFGAYLVLSLVSFAIARSLTKWVEKAELKEYNQHLGGILGLLKGGLLVVVVTFLVVTVSPDARTALKDSKTGWVCAQVMYHVHPILPPKLHAAVADYIHALDDPELEKKYAEFGHVHDPEHAHDDAGNAPIFGGQPPITNQNGGSAVPWSGSGNTAPAGSSGTLFSQLSNFTIQKLEQSIGGADPTQQPQIRDHISGVLNQLTPEQRQNLETNIANASQEQVANLLNEWLRLPAPQPQPRVQPQPPVQPQPTGPGSVAQPNRNAFSFLNESAPTVPPAGASPTPAAPASTSATQFSPQQLATRRQELALKIAGKVTTFPAIQNQIAQQIDGVLVQARVPDGVAVSILDDWYADVAGGVDPVPATNRDTTPQQRIVYHMQALQAQSPQQPGPF